MGPDPILTHIVALLVGLQIGVSVTAFFTIRAALKDIRELSAKTQS
jgi:hypothetical protein